MSWLSFSIGRFANHPVLTMSFLVFQVVALADYNQQVLHLQEATNSNTVYQILCQRVKKLQISIFGITITHVMIKGLMVSAVLASARTSLMSMLS